MPHDDKDDGIKFVIPLDYGRPIVDFGDPITPKSDLGTPSPDTNVVVDFGEPDLSILPDGEIDDDNSGRPAVVKGEEPQIIVTTKVGKLKGRIESATGNRKVYAFLGVPFAEPPLGPLRFAKPVPVKAWSGVKNAQKLPKPCCQVTESQFME